MTVIDIKQSFDLHRAEKSDKLFSGYIQDIAFLDFSIQFFTQKQI